MKVPILPALLLLLPLSSCVTYQVTRSESDTPIDGAVYQALEVGETHYDQTIDRLGPPDRLVFHWEPGVGRFTRIEYIYLKGTLSDLSIGLPVQEISNYNTGVRFFLIFFNVLRGGSVVPPELRALEIIAPPSPESAGDQVRLSEMRSTLQGRPTRMSGLRRSREDREIDTKGPLSPFVPLNLEGEGRGLDLIRLEFDEKGILVRKEIRQSTPRTDLKGQLKTTILQ